MGKSHILELLSQSLQMQKLQAAIAQTSATLSPQSATLSPIEASGLTGSTLSFFVAQSFKEIDAPIVLIFNDKEEAAYHLNDLEQLLNDKDVLFYPGSYRRPYQIEETDNANVLLRAEVLNRINSRKKPALIVTYPDALFEKVVTRKELDKNTLKIKLEDTISLDFLNEVLFEYKFKRVDFVTEPGEFSVRGGIVDVFSFSHDEPYRIEFFGDEVDSIRTFDVETQLSTEKVSKITIIPNVANKLISESRESFLKYVSNKTVVFVKNKEFLFDQLDTLYQKAEEAFAKLTSELKHANPQDLFANASLLQKQLQEFRTVTLGNQQKNISTALDETKSIIKFNSKPQPSFNKKFNLLIENLNQNYAKNYTNYIFCASEQQAKRFHDIFEEVEQDVHYKTVVMPLHQGFVWDDLKIACYTDHQILNGIINFI